MIYYFEWYHFIHIVSPTIVDLVISNLQFFITLKIEKITVLSLIYEGGVPSIRYYHNSESSLTTKMFTRRYTHMCDLENLLVVYIRKNTLEGIIPTKFLWVCKNWPIN